MNEPVTKSTKTTALVKIMKIILFIAVTICLFFPISAYLRKNDASLLGYRSFIVLTGSMSPYIDAGSYIIIKEKMAEDIAVGDVITYRVDSATVLTHRVVEVYNDGTYSFITKGDANNVADRNPVMNEQILGEVVFWVNGLGTFLISLRQPKMLITISVLVSLGFLVSNMLSMIVKKRTGKG